MYGIWAKAYAYRLLQLREYNFVFTQLENQEVI